MKGIPLIIEPAPCSCFLGTSLCCRMRFLIIGACRAALLLCSVLSQSTAHFPFGSQHECHWKSSDATSLPELVAYQRFSLLTVMVSIPFHAFHAQNVSVEPLHSGCMVVCRHSQESQCSHGLVYKWLKDDEIRRYLLLATVLEGFLAENKGIPCNCSIVTPPCFVELRSTQGIAGGSVLELDSGEQLFLEASASFRLQQNGSDDEEGVNQMYTSRIPRSFLQLTVSLSNPGLVDFLAEEEVLPSAHKLSLSLWQKQQFTVWLMEEGSTAVTFTIPRAPSSCTAEQTSLTLTVQVGCPTSKTFKLVYPDGSWNASQHTYWLPVNYRPPSSLGASIATSPNVYNVDPRVPLRSSRFKLSQESALLKQCQGKGSRQSCNCTGRMRDSVDVTHSDCMERVYEHVFSNPFPLDLRLVTDSKGSVKATGNCTLLEVNGRAEYELNGTTGAWLALSNGNYHIKFRASGLYHFRVEVVSRESFCHLQTQFAVFVTKQPLSKAVEYSLSTFSTIVSAGALLCTFLCYKQFHRRFHRDPHHSPH